MVPGYVLHITTRSSSKKKVSNNSQCSHGTPYTNLRNMQWNFCNCNQQMHTTVIRSTIIFLYRVSQEECARLRESVRYVKVYRYNPKHLYPKLNGYGDNGQRKVGASCGSKYCNLHSRCVTRGC